MAKPTTRRMGIDEFKDQMLNHNRTFESVADARTHLRMTLGIKRSFNIVGAMLRTACVELNEAGVPTLMPMHGVDYKRKANPQPTERRVAKGQYTRGMQKRVGRWNTALQADAVSGNADPVEITQAALANAIVQIMDQIPTH